MPSPHYKPTIRLPQNREIWHREYQWRLRKLAELFVAKNDRCQWAHVGNHRWVIQIGEATACLDRVMVPSDNPIHTPHKPRLQCYRTRYRQMGDEPDWDCGFVPDPPFDYQTLVGGETLYQLQELVWTRYRNIMTDLFTELEYLGV